MFLKVPLLRPLREKGATLYVFPSANEDIGLNLDSRTTGVSLSHYALLNIPAFSSTDNKLGTELLAEELLNYVMNFETLLLNQDSYNYQDYHTVSEKVFWHWFCNKTAMMETTEVYDEYLKEQYSQSENTLVESTDRTVLCFGSIDAGNSLSTEFGMFNETYINIPTSYGAGPVYFKKCNPDLNYLFTKYNGDSNILQGRSSDVTGYLNSMTPLYDEGSYYNTESGAIEIVKDITEISEIIKKEYDVDNISSFDDINVDIHNKLNLTDEFKFNAILLYYSIYDLDDTTKSPYAINLFGIIFLDGPVKNTDGNYYITPFVKKKSTDGYFGNSYSFRVNIKTMSVYDNTDAVIQDNTTLSSIYSLDFSDVISNLNRAIDTMNTNVHTTMAILNAYMNILTYYDDLRETIKDLSTQLNSLVNGSLTNTFNVNTITLSDIKTNDETDVINIQVLKEYNDVTDSLDDEIYTPSVIIKNDHNIPAFYYPLVNTTIELSEVNNVVLLNNVNVKNIIDAIDVSWYTNKNAKLSTNDTFVYPIINLDKETLNNNYVRSLYDSSDNLNYNMLVTYLLSYTKTLNKIELSENDWVLIADNLDLSDELDKLVDDKLNTVNTLISINKNSISTVNNNITNINKDILNINERISELGSVSGSIDVKSLESKISSNTENIDNLSNTLTLTTSNVNTLNSKLDNVSTNISNISTNLNSVQALLSEFSNRISTIDVDLTTLRKDINANIKSIENLNTILTEINTKLNDVLKWKTM